jgi:hypothetical protein
VVAETIHSECMCEGGGHGGEGDCRAIQVRTDSGPNWMCSDIFDVAQLWRGRLLMTGHLSSRHPVVVGAGHVVWGSGCRAELAEAWACSGPGDASVWGFSSVSHL